MSATNNIPDIHDSWMQAEKMLDRHFRQKKVLRGFLLLLIPVAAVFSYFYFNNSQADKSRIAQNESSYVNNSVSNNNTNSKEINNTSIIKSTENKYSTTTSQSTESNIEKTLTPVGGPTASAGKGPVIQNSSASSKSYENNKDKKQIVADANRTSNSNHSAAIIGAVALSSSSVSKPENNKIENASNSNSIQQVSSSNENITSGNSAKITQPDLTVHSKEEIFTLASIQNLLQLPEQPMNVKMSSQPKIKDKYHSGGISWQASVYGGANYVTKSLTIPADWSVYNEQRKDNEENIFTPAFGVSLTAAIRNLSLSVGAEYSIYGEKTNYYPFSIQNRIVDNGNWNAYFVTYIDTDTAYVIGNRYFVQSSQLRLDSSFNSDLDTIQEYKYDASIAEKNGVNHITYVEIPVMVTYNIISGRTGVGVSGGVSTGLLTGRSGYYIKSDGKGVESLEEIDGFRKVVLNGRVGLDIYYRMNARMCLNLRPQIKTNLNSVFEDNYSVKQKYSSAGVLFGVSWLLN
jgi:hypothetical protein